MPLSTADKLENQRILNELFNTQELVSVSNKETHQKTILDLLDQFDISLFTYNGDQYRRIFIEAITAAIRDNNFKQAIENVAKQFLQLDKQLHFKHANQPREESILDDLRTKRYSGSNRLLSNKDLKDFFDLHLKHLPSVNYTDDCCITTDNGQLLRANLKASQTTPGTLFIPVNIDQNHWTLIIRKETAQGTSLTYWDPKACSAEQKERVRKIVDSAVLDVYGKKSPAVNYQYPNEQPDGITCGQRIAQKALIEVGIKNQFTAVPPNDTKGLTEQFVQSLLQKEPIEPIAKVQKVATVKDTMSRKKLSQEESDRYLAIALQDIYRKNPSIASDVAFNLAKEQINNTSYTEFKKTKKEVIIWTEKHFFFKTATSQSKSCAAEAREDVIQPVTPVTVVN